ncbi:MAG: replication-relaxation family protein [Candidatus Poribacteria bacterium]|nr:replication-relaxation family protein [Candidatus Poribacteria bacterium]
MREPLITDRDIGVVLDLYKHRYLTTAQVERLRFPSRQTANRRLRVLIEHDYLKGYQSPGVEDRVFYLTPRGIDLVAQTLQCPTDELRAQRVSHAPKDYYFLKHFIALNDFRITLTQALETRDDLGLLGFIPEHHGEKTAQGGWTKYIRDFVCDIHDPERRIGYTPDAVFALRKGDGRALFFVEIDRGTEVLTNPEKGFLRAVGFYYRYFIEEGYQRYADDFKCEPFKGFRVLFVTTSETRVENMRAAASELNLRERRFIWLTNMERIAPETIFAEIWKSAEMSDPNAYRIG